MAAGAGDRQTEERLAERADEILHLVEPRGLLHLGRALGVCDVVPRAADVIPRGDQRIEVARVQHIPGDLLSDELVVGQVAVERLDHPVAVAPGVVADMVVLEALTLAEPHHVEPVPRPALAVSGRVEQAIDQLLVGCLVAVLGEALDFLRLGRKPRQVEGESPDERPPVGLGRGVQVPRLELRQDEPVDAVPGPPRIPNGRGGRVPDGLERPPVVARAAVGGRKVRIDLGHPPHGTVSDPAPQSPLLGVGQGPTTPGHLARIHVVQQRTRLRLAGNDGRSTRAAGQGGLLGHQGELPFLERSTVALQAVSRQDGSDLGIEGRRAGRVAWPRWPGLGDRPVALRELGESRVGSHREAGRNQRDGQREARHAASGRRWIVHEDSSRTVVSSHLLA